MIKLPLLQPHLTGKNGIDNRSKSIECGSLLRWSLLNNEDGDNLPLEVRNWHVQGSDVTHSVVASEKYKSLALHAEVKLAEALEKCNMVSPSAATGDEKPSKLHAAVTCQLLGEFAELCGPLSDVMKKIRDEVVRCIYSLYYVSERGSLTFDQLPWFSVAERLETEKAALMKERDEFQAQLVEQQELIGRIEAQMGHYREAMEAAQIETAELRTQVVSLHRSEDAAKSDAKAGRDELKRVRKETMKMKEKMEECIAENAQLRERLERTIKTLKEDLNFSMVRTKKAEEGEATARAEADRRLPPEIIARLKSQVDDYEATLKLRERVIIDLKLEIDRLKEQIDSMTPRPDWGVWEVYGLQKADTTQDTLVAAAGILETYLKEVPQKEYLVKVSQALLAPDPLPRPFSLSITVDSSAYFITEGGSEDGRRGGGRRTPTAAPLGLMPSVPRCLRWDKDVELVDFNLEETEALVAHIWKEKRVFDMDHPPTPLLSFLFHYFNARCVHVLEAAMRSAAISFTTALLKNPERKSSNAAATIATTAAVAANPTPIPNSQLSSTAPSAENSSSSIGRYGPPTPVGGYPLLEAPCAVYSLVNAVGRHSSSSPSCRLFWAVITGALPEGAYADQQLMLSGVHAALRVRSELPRTLQDGSEPVRGICHQDMAHLLPHLFPTLPSFVASRIASALTSGFSSDLAPVSQVLNTIEWFTEASATEPGTILKRIPRRRQRITATSGDGSNNSASKQKSARSDPDLRPWLMFVLAVMDLHLEGVNRSYSELAAEVAESLKAPTSPGLDKEVELEALLKALEKALGHDKAESVAAQVLGAAGPEHLRGLSMSHARVSHEAFMRRLSSMCWLKPKMGSWDVASALIWAGNLADAETL